MEKNEFQNRVFLFSNFPGAAILNNCDVQFIHYRENVTTKPHKVTLNKGKKSVVIINLLSSYPHIDQSTFLVKIRYISRRQLSTGTCFIDLNVQRRQLVH